MPGPPVYGKGLRAALVFARVPRGGGSVPPRPPRVPQLSEGIQANGLEALLRAAQPIGSGRPLLPSRPPLLPSALEANAGIRAPGQRPPLPRSEDVKEVTPKASTEAEPWRAPKSWTDVVPKNVPAPGARSFCGEASRPARPTLPQIPIAVAQEHDTGDDDDDDACGDDGDDGDEGHEMIGSGFDAGGDEVVLLSEDMDPLNESEHEAESNLHTARDDFDAGGDDEDARSDASSDSAEEVPEDASKREEEALGDEAAAAPREATSEAAPTITPRKKKKKKRKKKRRASSKQTVEEVPTKEKRPGVPRFPHPVKCDTDFLPVAATTIPMADRGPATQNMKERLSKNLLLGRFPRRPLASLLGEGLEEGAAREAEAGDGEERGTGSEFTSLAAAESLGLVLESSNSTWTRPRRSQSHDGARASRSGGGAGDATGDEALLHGSKADAHESKRRHRARSEAPRGNDLSDGGLGLSIVGQKSKTTTNKLSIGSKQWLAAQAQEEKKRVQESGDAALGSLYFSFSSMKDADGKKIVLQKREKVVRILHELNTKVAIPLSRFYGIRYNFFSEHHCQAKKAGVTVKEPLILKKQLPDGTVTEETRHLVTIRIRIRVHPTKGDPQTTFISRGTQMAILLHELAHLKHMNHGKDFMLFLRDIFAKATSLGVFDAAEMVNEIPSPWPWENEIFRTGGQVSNEELLALFQEHKALQKEKARAALSESARKEADAAVAEAAAADLGLPKPTDGAASTEAQKESLPHESDRLAAATPSDVASPVLPPASPMPDVGAEDDGEASASAVAVTPPTGIPSPPPIGSVPLPSSSSSPRQRRKPKAFCGSPSQSGSLSLASAFQKGAQKACEGACECCADPDAPTEAEYGEEGDKLYASTDGGSPPDESRRSRSQSRGRARSESLSRNSSVVKLPQISSASPYPPPRLEAAARGQGVVPLPPVI